MTRFEPVFFDIETTTLNPMEQKWWSHGEHDAEVICVGLGVLTGEILPSGEPEAVVKVLDAGSEYELLMKLHATVEDFFIDGCGLTHKQPPAEGWEEDVEPFFVGWNNRSFDHPYIGARFARKRLVGYPFTHGWKRLDGMQAIRSKTGRFWSQDDWMENIGTRHEDEITGAEVPKLWEQGRIDVIRKHCKTDIQDLIDIFLHDREVMMDHFYDHYDLPWEAAYGEEVEL